MKMDTQLVVMDLNMLYIPLIIDFYPAYLPIYSKIIFFLLLNFVFYLDQRERYTRLHSLVCVYVISIYIVAGNTTICIRIPNDLMNP